MIQNKRAKIRQIGGKDASVKFKPANAAIAYQFKLRDYSAKGLGILVKEESKVLKMLNVGDELEMKYYPGEGTSQPVLIKTQINHISPPEQGKHQKHLIIGLYILD